MDLMGGPSNPRACRHPQGRICDNLKYGLHQMKIRGQREAYLAVIEAVIVGPEVRQLTPKTNLHDFTSFFSGCSDGRG